MGNILIFPTTLFSTQYGSGITSSTPEPLLFGHFKTWKITIVWYWMDLFAQPEHQELQSDRSLERRLQLLESEMARRETSWNLALENKVERKVQSESTFSP